MRWEDRKARRMADTPERLGWTGAFAVILGVIFCWALLVGVLAIGGR